MKNTPVRLVGLWLSLCSAVFASLSAPPLTSKERAQGFREHRILAKPRADLRAATADAERREGLRVRRSFPRMGDLRVLDLESGDSAERAIRRLRATGRYEYVERDQLLYARVTPNDPAFGQQWPLRNTGQADGVVGADIAATAGWDIQRSASDVIVAVVDSGARLTHQDLAANLWRSPTGTHGINAILSSGSSGYTNPSDDSGHGTHVAGIIGAVGNNAVGIAGVAWNVKLMPLKFIDDSGTGSASDAVECINYAIENGADVINASYGSFGYSLAQFEAIKAARDAGIIFVAAAGNESTNNDTVVDYPSGYALDNIVSVAWSTSRDELSSSSNIGSGSVELAAPGDQIYSTYDESDSSYETLSGTSMAAPHVSGAIALLRARFPSDTYRQTINRLLRSTTRLSAFQGKVQTGGRLDLARALSSTVVRPFNDDFAERAVLSGANLRIRSSNADATAESTEPLHAEVSRTRSLWWTWKPSESTRVFFDTAGSAGDTVLAVYTGSSLNALQPFAINDDAVGTTSSRVVADVTANTTYQIAVAVKGDSPGLVMLKVGTVPTNDGFANARTIAGSNIRVAGTTLNATRESNEPSTAGVGAGHSVWYRWTAPVSAHHSLAVYATTTDTAAAVYTGASLASLTRIAANDNNQGSSNTDALVSFEAAAGTTYYLQVDHAGTSTEEGGDFILTLTDSLWEFPTLDEITSSPAVAADGTVYFGAGSDDATDPRVYAVDSSGSLRWRFTTGAEGVIGGSPTIGSDGTVYIGAMDSIFYALNGATGTKKWSYALGSPIYGAPAVAANGTVYVRDDTKLYALTATGTLKWSHTLNGTAAGGTYCSPVIAADGTIYVGTTGGTFYALSDQGSSPAVKWTYTADGDIYTSPAIAGDGTIYFGTLEGSFYALTPGATSATAKWSFKLPAFNGGPNSISSSPALAPDGTIYFAAYDHKLYAVNPQTSTIKWTYTLGDEVRASSPAVDAAGNVYVGAYDGLVYAVRATGTLLRTYPSALRVRSSPVIAGTRLYFGSIDAKLHAFDLGRTAANSAWPMFQHDRLHTGRQQSGAGSITLQPQSQVVAPGATVTLAVEAATTGQVSYQWMKDGSPIAGATGAALVLANITPANSGVYTAQVNAGTPVISNPAIIGLAAATKITGDGREVLSNQPVAGKVYDQILLEGTAVSVTADPGQITRTSFIDLNDDIVQVEFSGAGTLTLVLENVSGPAAPVNYDQPAVLYRKGHPRIIITGADASTNVSVFTVGTITSQNPGLFKPGVTYGAVAEVAYLAVLSSDGKLGGIRTANTSYLATKGVTGVVAPGVRVLGPVYVGDITAGDSAKAMLMLGGSVEAQINGGDLLQSNGGPVSVSGITQLRFVDGMTSHGARLPAQANRARLEEDGEDVTAQIVVNPVP